MPTWFCLKVTYLGTELTIFEAFNNFDFRNMSKYNGYFLILKCFILIGCMSLFCEVKGLLSKL